MSWRRRRRWRLLYLVVFAVFAARLTLATSAARPAGG
jgi:hypothetical protein